MIFTGCLGDIPAVPKISKDQYISSCSDKEWGQYVFLLFGDNDTIDLSFVAPFTLLLTLLLIQIISFVCNSCLAKRIDSGGNGVQLVSSFHPSSSSDDEGVDDTITVVGLNGRGNHLKYKRKYQVSLKTVIKGRDVNNNVHLSSCTPYVQQNASVVRNNESIKMSLTTLMLSDTLQRTETHVRICVFQPVDTIGIIQKSKLMDETPGM